MRQTANFPIDDLVSWKKLLLFWAASQEYGIYLDSNRFGLRSNSSKTPKERISEIKGWECLAAADASQILEANAGKAFEQLKTLQQNQDQWLFGFFSYDLKNEVEQLSSQHFDGIGLPDLGFFQAGTVVSIQPKFDEHSSAVVFSLEIQTNSATPEAVFERIKNATPSSFCDIDSTKAVKLSPRISKPEYLKTVDAIRRHIAEGDIYEMNFCQEFFAENAKIDPLKVFERLNDIGKAPFTTFLRWRDRYLLSASPERFLKKAAQKLITQPIKGTRRRGNTPAADELIRQELVSSEKDRSENVMIVDLVRNDFSRNCLPGTVIVEELCGIYSFATVHQMISTITGILPENADSLRALRDCFPMGSMTGAPKIMSMELIERFERTRRGLYSGAVGYFAPNGDFDFNVVIRSILYNSENNYISAQVGGAIVFDSVPEQEYDECMVKVDAMMRALEPLKI